MDDVGTAGACLGLSSKLMEVTALNSSTVKITYGGGDEADSTPRQVDVYINCNDSASVLDFVTLCQQYH